MWRPEKRFFYSLRADDDAVADVKEVIGVYPFYFGMVPWGKGYESAWASILDPKQFWTTWPVASASKECPAYSQTNWPGDGRAAGCMWNGPTWPHANSLVMTAMARTLRATRDTTSPTPRSRRNTSGRCSSHSPRPSSATRTSASPGRASSTTATPASGRRPSAITTIRHGWTS